MNGSEWPAQDHRFDSTSIDNRYGITVTNGHVTQISLDGNNLSGDIPLMSHLSQLQSFSMVGNHIHNITNYAFSGLGNLQYLWLSSNEVAEISRTAFAGMSGLLNLDLSTNQIMGIS
ncbi:MAG: leucine-rich repeat domain-containing protein [bacterium]